jgi:sulfofructose kinase
VERILVLGYNALDVVVPVSGYPPADSKCELEAIHLGGGGPAATAAVALARLGATVSLITPLCDDVPGAMQRAELEAAGVDLSRSPTVGGGATPRAVILVDAACEERTIFWSRGGVPRLSAADVSPAWLEGCDLFYTDGHEPAAGAVLAGAARRLGLPVVLDAGNVREGTHELVALATDVIASSGFVVALTGERSPLAALRALSRLGPERVGATYGRAGCVALCGDELQHVPAFDVPVLDTTGAGDAFHAGYALARARGLGLRACLEHGSAVAALKCRDWGGRRGLPTADEVAALLATGRRRAERPPLA